MKKYISMILIIIPLWFLAELIVSGIIYAFTSANMTGFNFFHPAALLTTTLIGMLILGLIIMYNLPDEKEGDY